MAGKVRAESNRWVDYALTAVILGAVVLLVTNVFERLPIEGTSLAIDWKGLWQGLQPGHITYGNATGLRIAPWSLPAVMPLGYLSFRSSWGVLTLATIAILVVSVPHRRPRVLLSTLLLVLSWPSLRHIADGNFEGLIIAGVLITIYGFRTQKPLILALGLFLATAKVQETWLLMGVLGLYLLMTWPRQKLLILGAIVGLVVIPSLIFVGPTWLNGMGEIRERGSIMDITLGAAIGRMGIGTWMTLLISIILVGITLYVVWMSQRTMTREKAGMLIALSLVLSAYAAGNSFLTVLAIGIIPVFQSRPTIGAILIVLADLPSLFYRDIAFNWGAYYSTGLLLVTWAVLGWQVYRKEITQRIVPKNEAVAQTN